MKRSKEFILQLNMSLATKGFERLRDIKLIKPSHRDVFLDIEMKTGQQRVLEMFSCISADHNYNGQCAGTRQFFLL